MNTEATAVKLPLIHRFTFPVSLMIFHVVVRKDLTFEVAKI